MSSVVMLPSGRFRGFARHKGMKEAKVFDHEDRAKAWADATEKRMERGAWVPPVKGEADQFSRTFKAAAESYLASPQFAAKKDTTRHGEKHKLKPAIAGLGNLVLEQVTVVDVENHLAERALVQPKRAQWKAARAKEQKVEVPAEVAKRKLSRDQRRLELAAISAVFNYAREQKWVTENPTWHVKRPGTTRRTKRVDDDVSGAILQFMNNLGPGFSPDGQVVTEGDERPYLYFSLLFSCLARPGEVAKAEKSWLRSDPPQIVLPSDASKNEDDRVIVIAQALYKDLVEYLERQPSDCPYIFATLGRDKSWRPYNYAVPWAKAREALGLEALVPHLARHEGISRLFERTELSDGQIASLSGHRTPQALWRYKHLRNELQRSRIEDLHRDVMEATSRAVTSIHPSRGLKPGERLGENRAVKKRANAG